jgi:AraC-like DNA-binding protein
MLGWSRFPRTQVHGLKPHRHDTFEICYIADGSVVWWVDNERFEVRRGDVFYTRPGELHGGADAMMHPCELYWVQVAADEETAPLFRSLATEGLRRFPAVSVEAPFSRLIDEHRTRGTFAAPAARATLLHLLVEVIRAREARSEERCLSPEIGTAIEWMTARLGEAFCVQEVAEAVGLHPSRFHERFLAEVGQTPAEWRVRQRIAIAEERLRMPGASVTSVAFALGFASSQYFATAFKKYTGRTPSEYRQSLAAAPETNMPSRQIANGML